MTPAWIGFLIIVAFGVLMVTFATASRMAEIARPYIGIGLLISIFFTLFLDTFVWFVAESLIVVLYFMRYPNADIKGLLAPIVVLAGILMADVLLVALVGVGISITIILRDLGIDLSDDWAGTVLFTSLTTASTLFVAYKGIRHLAPKLRLALRVLGRNV